jgi:4-hydroxysphinganine ceramide fatty acyl 2-hydroxylase
MRNLKTGAALLPPIRVGSTAPEPGEGDRQGEFGRSPLETKQRTALPQSPKSVIFNLMSRQYLSKRNETVRMFRSDFMEFVSHSHPLVPLVLYLPVVGCMLYLSFWQRNLSIFTVAGLFVIGLLIWTLVEYIIHRYVFHYRSASRWAQRLHFIVHGSHHDYPNDVTRISTPPSISIPIAVLFYVICTLILGRFAPPVFAGLGIGYIFYETIHYASHHFPMKRGVWRWLKQNHLQHHYQDDHFGYGVSTPLWDHVFGSKRH